MVRRTIGAMLGFILLAWSASDARKAPANALDTLQPGHWYEVPNSRLNALDPCPARNCSWSGVEGVSAVMDDWSGGAFDTQRDRLIVWGGGHGGYAGNEIYVFDLNTLAWQRLTNPSAPPGVDVAYAPDGGPTSRHTYNYLQYLPAPVDRFCTFGGAGFYQSGQTGTRNVDAFDFAGLRWETQRFASVPAYNIIGAVTAVDPSTGRLWMHGCHSSWLSDFDPAANRWTAHGDQFSGTYLDYYKTADIDPTRRRMLAVGRNEVWSWDIGATGNIPGVPLTTIGATEILTANSPGFVYAPVLDRFVAWKGGADIYTLNMATLAWTRVAPAATNTVIPTAPNMNGTFGRFRYSPARNALVVVNGVNQNVYVYKLAAGGSPPPTDTQPPSVPTNLQATAVSSSQIDLSWSASTDNVGVAGYRVYRGGTQIATATGTSTSDTGLAASTSYTYTVAAYDAAGNASAPSSPATATTQSGGPPPADQPPALAFTSPADRAILSGTAAVNARANDPDAGTADGAGILNVAFQLLQGTTVVDSRTESTATYDWSLDTSLRLDGVYTLRAMATSTAAAGGTSTTVDLTVLIANTPGSDSDGNGLPDAWEWASFGSLGQNPTADPDGDLFTNLEESQAGTDPLDPASTPGSGAVSSGDGGGGCGATGADAALLLLLVTAAGRGGRRRR